MKEGKKEGRKDRGPHAVELSSAIVRSNIKEGRKE